MHAERDCAPMMLCNVLGFLPAFREAKRLRPDLPREAWEKASEHQCARWAQPGCRVTPDDVWMLAEHFHCMQARAALVQCG